MKHEHGKVPGESEAQGALDSGCPWYKMDPRVRERTIERFAQFQEERGGETTMEEDVRALPGIIAQAREDVIVSELTQE